MIGVGAIGYLTTKLGGGGGGGGYNGKDPLVQNTQIESLKTPKVYGSITS